MRRSLTLLVWLILTAPVVGCAYYNGLFNANRLAGDAERAEREGRSGEARSLWAQAAVKAESVATRYPNSRYRDDALLLWGRGHFETENCRDAVDPLALAVDSSPEQSIRADARLYLARCHLELRHPDSAVTVLEPLVADSGSGAASEARLLMGRAELAQGRYAAAVEVLKGISAERTAFALAAAYVGLNRLDSAIGVLAARVPGRYAEQEWLGILDSVGVMQAEPVSTLVEQLVGKSELTEGQRARLQLLGDGRRWMVSGEPTRAAQRFAGAAEAAPDSIEWGAASAYLAIAELRGADDLSLLPEIKESLDASIRRGGSTIAEVNKASVLLGHVLSVLEEPQAPNSDLRMFIVAEELRDSLEAIAPAFSVFLKLQQDHPQSVVAPKALLAAAAMDPASGDSVLRKLQTFYPRSPYTLVLAGAGAAEFAVLEDSLAVMLDRERVALSRGAAAAEEELQEGIRR